MVSPCIGGEVNRKRCVCDGRYEGCEHGRFCGVPVIDDGWGPWCEECNPRRLAHITKSLEEMRGP
jgi:hypothetical protein